MLKKITEKIISGKSLSEDESYESFKLIMEGNSTDIEISAFLTALATKGETTTEIIGAAKILREKATTIISPKDTIDCCGTGGDGHTTYNISTAVSFICAACDVTVAKHGNRSASSKAGAADTLEASGINLNITNEQTQKALLDIGFAFLMAPNHHKAMKNVGKVRKQLGYKTIFNLIGPLSNPAKTTRQLIGVYDKKWLEPLAKTLQNLGTKKAWLVHGSDGLDEITLTGKTYVCELDEGKIRNFTITPSDFGLPTYNIKDIKGGSAKENSEELIKLLDGKQGAYRDFVIANAAVALIVSGKYSDIKQSVGTVVESIDSGNAKELFEKYKNFTNKV